MRWTLGFMFVGAALVAGTGHAENSVRGCLTAYQAWKNAGGDVADCLRECDGVAVKADLLAQCEKGATEKRAAAEKEKRAAAEEPKRAAEEKPKRAAEEKPKRAAAGKKRRAAQRAAKRTAAENEQRAAQKATKPAKKARLRERIAAERAATAEQNRRAAAEAERKRAAAEGVPDDAVAAASMNQVTTVEPQPGAVLFPTSAHRPALVYIPGTGSQGFLMGSPEGEHGRDQDEDQHRVVLSPFLLTATEVTQGQFAALTGQRPSYFGGSDALPAERVSWYDALAFANRLSAREQLTRCYELSNPKGQAFRGLSEGNPGAIGNYTVDASPVLDRFGRWRCTGYRLPTESEWEWAARGGTTTRYWHGDAESDLAAAGWYADNSKGKTHEVAQKPRNPFGLYDVHGNVWEWCYDGYDPTYPTTKQGDPLGPRNGAIRVLRGGSWFLGASRARSADRSWWHGQVRFRLAGFRLARQVPPGSSPTE